MAYKRKNQIDDYYIPIFKNFKRNSLTQQFNPLVGLPITDSEGLDRAYNQGDAYMHGDTLYIAGSHTARDWYDDITKVPVWGDLKNSERYQQAEKALKNNPNIKNVVGHSLGGVVALEWQKQYPNLQSRTYSAPVWNLTGNEDKAQRYRNWFDPVSVFDRSAKKTFKTNPFDSWNLTHSYNNIANKFSSGGASNSYGWQNQDKSYSLIQYVYY